MNELFSHRLILILCLVITLFLFGCGNNSTSKANNHNESEIQFTKLNTSDAIDQQVSNEAKQIISKFNEIKAVKAVNSKDAIVTAVEVDHLERFTLQEVKEKVEKKLKKEIKQKKVIVSTDKKIFLELDKLEAKLQSKELSKEKLDKKIKEIIKLSKEQT